MSENSRLIKSEKTLSLMFFLQKVDLKIYFLVFTYFWKIFGIWIFLSENNNALAN